LPKDAGTQLGEEQRDLETIRGKVIAVGIRDSPDDPFEPEPTQIVGHLCSTVANVIRAKDSGLTSYPDVADLSWHDQRDVRRTLLSIG
jgi:hypothetical protein